MSTQNKIQALVAAAALLTEKQPPFAVGDLIVWKSEKFKIMSTPAIGQPVVVTQVHDVAVRPVVEELCGTPYFNEPLDIAAGSFDKDGEFVEFHYDSRRMRVATQEEIDAWDAENNG